MMEDMRKVLESLVNGDISPEEAEMLIKALKERDEGKEKEDEKEKKDKKWEKEEKSLVVEEGEKMEGDMVVSGQRVVIKGEVDGDVVLTSCDTYFSGKVEGDLVLIGGRVRFDGGYVGGDLVLIGAKATGEFPSVMEDTVKISNLLATGILSAVSPILRGMGVSIRPGKKLKKYDNLVIENDESFDKNIYAESIHVKARMKARNVHAEEIVVEKHGVMEAIRISADEVTVYGKVEAAKLEADELLVDGEVAVDKLRCDILKGNGRVLVRRSSDVSEVQGAVKIIKGGEDRESFRT